MKVNTLYLCKARFLFSVFMLCFALFAFAQSNVQIKGVVLSTTNESIIGANVIEIGVPTNGTVTDLNGNFTLTVREGAKLEISYIGYITQTVSIKNQKTLKVILKEDSQALDEVIVVGYGTQKKSDVTGSVTSVNTEQMMQRTPVSIAQGLQGAAAGVVVTQAGGDPTGGYSIRIRGVATMNGNTDPLWVVDGVQHGNSSNLDWLDPSDVESIEILKDASATAIYGSRGANGVILVTTKAGRVGKVRVDLKANYGISTLSRKMDMASLSDWLVAYRQSIENDGKTPFTAYNGQYDDQLHEIDWQDQMTQTSFRQQYNVSISGGSETMQANASFGYLDNNGIIVNSWHKRMTFRLNMQAKIKDIVRVGVEASFHTSKGKGGGSLINYARALPTMDYVDNKTGELVHVPVQYDDGSFGHYYYDPSVEYSAGKYASNPYADQYIRRYKDDWDNDNGSIRSSAWAEVNILKGLTFKTTVSMYYGSSNSWYYNSPYANTYYTYEQWSVNENGEKYGLDEFGTNGSASSSYGIENYFTYNLKINDHNLTAMVGQSASKDHGSWNNSSTKDLTFGFLRGFYSENPTDYNNGGGAPNISTRFASYFARVNYSFKDRYLITATVRRDGSSRFGKDNRWGTFPSASLAWRISEEDFIKRLNIFSNLKLRAGWGRTGNANVDATASVPQLSPSGVSFDLFENGQYVRYQGLAQTSEIDTGLKWETNEQTNVGLDVGLLNGNLNISMDYYIRSTKDLILGKTIRPSAGFTSITTNFGEIRNSGLEFSVNYNKQFTPDWFFSATLTGSTNKNKAIDIGDGTTLSGATGAGWENYQVCYNGLPLGTYQGYVVDYIFRDQAEIDALNAKAVEIYGPGSYYDSYNTSPGDFKFKDLNNDGRITDADKTYLGDGFVKLNYGLNLQVQYKNWDASMYIYGAFGQKILSWAKQQLTSIRNPDNGYVNLLSDYARNSWNKDNVNAPYPRLTRDDLSSNNRVSDYYVEKGDYLKISNFQIGYTFGRNLLGNVFRTARVYASVQNLATFSPYNKFGDPEVQSGVTSTGYDSGRYPFPRTFMFGLQVGF